MNDGQTRLPSREELLAFIRERSGKVGAREIARAFGAKNADRAALNRMLRELADEGQIDRRRKRLHHPAHCRRWCSPISPAATATASFWRGRPNGMKQAHGDRRSSALSTPRRARPGEVAGVGDRALIRIEKSADDETNGRVIKLIDRAKHRVLGIFRGLPGGGGRSCRSTRSSSAANLRSRPAPRPARDGDLVAVEVARDGRLGCRAARWLNGSARSRASGP